MQEWAPIGLMVVDEVSMLGVADIWRIHKQLQALKGSPDYIFGGIHMIFCGDFFQLPPVHATPLYRHMVAAHGAGPNASGAELWRFGLNAGAELTTNMRTRDDEQFAELLLRVRQNQHTREDIDSINARTLATAPPADACVVVPRNAQRRAVNGWVFRQFCRDHPLEPAAADLPGAWRRRGALRVLAHVVGADTAMAKRVRQRLDYTKNKKDKYQGTLDLLIGSTVLVVENIHIGSAIANGTMARVVDVLVNDDDVQFDSSDSRYGGGIHVANALQVRGLVLQHVAHRPDEQQQFPGLPVGCFPLLTEKSRTAAPDGKKQYSVRQLPVVPAFAMTGHKCQGTTLSALVVASWGDPSDRNYLGRNSTGWAYVVLSRVRTRNTLYLVDCMPDVSEFKPRVDIASEMQRLRRILFEPTAKRLAA